MGRWIGLEHVVVLRLGVSSTGTAGGRKYSYAAGVVTLEAFGEGKPPRLHRSR